jgi:quercetin dioxygenase-like cupin family protein
MNERQTSRPRPEHQTSGSDQRPARHLDLPTMSFDLLHICEELREEPSYLGGDRNARTLVMDQSLRVVLTVLRSGGRLQEHKAAGAISVQTLAGRIVLHALGDTIELPAGHLMTLETGVVHAVEAVEDSAFLLTLASA